LVRDYGDIEGEARACRSECALFDFSFVGRARITGPGALREIAALAGRRLDDMRPGTVRYALRTDAHGFLLSDLTIWYGGGDRYEVMSGRRQDLVDLAAATAPDAACEDLSERTATLAVQGPRSLVSLAPLVDVERLRRLSFFAHTAAEVAGLSCLIGRLGYTGERGFELIFDARHREEMWSRLCALVRPAGFAAADCLRIEAGFVLFANEFRVPVTPRAVALQKFAGTRADRASIELVCFRADTAVRPILWRPPPGIEAPTRPGRIAVTSACHSVIGGGTLGLGYVVADSAEVGARCVDPLGTFHNVRVAPRPFHDCRKQRQGGAWE
jgi:glycine cleavage system aminomethyltransferase T